MAVRESRSEQRNSVRVKTRAGERGNACGCDERERYNMQERVCVCLVVCVEGEGGTRVRTSRVNEIVALCLLVRDAMPSVGPGKRRTHAFQNNSDIETTP